MSIQTLTYSSELMQNYHQTELMSPEAAFQALQTTAGLGLLFSQNSAGALQLAQEQPGSASGWLLMDLSSAQIAKDFPGQSGVAVKSFATSQTLTDGSIRLAMAVADPNQDHLYLSLGNSASDLGWTSSPAWTSFPFDNPDVRPSAIKIVGIWLSDASDAATIVVDIVRQPGSQPALVSRFYIDPAKSNGYAWCQHDLPIDLQVDLYQTCPGRQAGSYSVEGLYTSGQIDGQPQFVFTPLYNAFNPSLPPSPARLNLPGGLSPDALASCRNADNSTDLYVAAQGTLYYFASANQHDQAIGVPLLTSPLLNGVRDLFACLDGGRLLVWGLDGSDQAFYTSCAPGQQTASGAWSLPLPILTGVDLISPYINRGNNANVFYASDGTNLFRMTQSPNTTLWSKQAITLPPQTPQAPARKFSSYTTRLQLTDGHQQPLAGTPLQITAASRSGFHINGLYYVLDSEPVTISTDAMGSLTLIEASQGINGTRLTVSQGSGDPLSINPMENPMNRVFQLNSVSSLQNAQITSPDGSSRPLVPAGTSSSNLQTVADSISALQMAQGQASPSGAKGIMAPKSRPSLAAVGAGGSLLGSIETDFGDLVSYLASGVDHLVEIIKDEATSAWNFVVTIAGKVYHAVLDGIEKVAAAAVWVFNAIKVAVEDLIQFLEFLFEWADISRTQKVLKNLVQLWVSDKINGIGELQSAFDGAIADAIQQINTLAGVTGWNSLGTAAASPLNAASTPTAGLTAPSTHLSSHFQNNAANLTQTHPPAPPNPQNTPIQTLFQAIQSEATVIDNVYAQIAKLANEAASLSLEQILERVAAILADSVLASIQTVADALFQLLQEIASAAFAVLDTPIYIPVVSDILSDFGVPSLSMLDLFCWIAAVPVTLAYKAAHSAAPFPDDSNTAFLTSANSWTDVVSAFSGPAGSNPAGGPQAKTFPMASKALAPSASPAAVGLADPIPSLPASVANTIFVAGHSCAGFFTLMACFTDSFEAAEETGDNAFAIPSAIVNILAGAADGVAVTLAPQAPLQNTAVTVVYRATLAARILAKLIFSGPAQSKFAASTGILKNLKVDDGRATGGIVDAILVFPALGCSAWHFAELAKDPQGTVRTNAILEETANLTAYVSRIGYSVAVNAEDPDTKTAAIVVMDIANVAYTGLEFAEACIGMG